MHRQWRLRCLVAVIAVLTLGTGQAWAAAGTLWQSDFTNAGFATFRSTPWNNVGASAPVLVTSTVAAPEKAARFTVPGGGTRSEIEPDVANFVEGDEFWFASTFTLPASFPAAETSWQVLGQWKNADTGSPPLEIKVGRGSVILDGGYGYPGGPAGSKYWTTTLGPAVTTTATTLVLHVKFSSNPSVGYVDAWLNGTPVLTGYHPVAGTLYPSSKKTKASASQAKAQKEALDRTPQPKDTPKEPAASTDTLVKPSTTSSQYSYWKMGMYRDPAITSTAVYDLESARMGTSYAAVQ
ncbi:heparin lyase I family protein [Actinomycetospora soli]|uniref:heparin lyase I family protein n=1 Tax=Actinomycetospora soli TaxID=2893887 RepID=UPI001E46576D|nr:heparin lyase I family protein [Actinomycetospora soli]MCD2187774.1 polysaccharide lyase [Actinomycetospora soli]